METAAVLGKSQAASRRRSTSSARPCPFGCGASTPTTARSSSTTTCGTTARPRRSSSPAGGPYKKDDNAHIEQKNWTHVRKLLGYVRYDSPAAQAAINALYRHELRLFQNLFLPSVKLLAKERVGARVRRRYDAPRTPLERVLACPEITPRGGR